MYRTLVHENFHTHSLIQFSYLPNGISSFPCDRQRKQRLRKGLLKKKITLIHVKDGKADNLFRSNEIGIGTTAMGFYSVEEKDWFQLQIQHGKWEFIAGVRGSG